MQEKYSTCRCTAVILCLEPYDP